MRPRTSRQIPPYPVFRKVYDLGGESNEFLELVPPEVTDRVVRMVTQPQIECASRWSVIGSLAKSCFAPGVCAAGMVGGKDFIPSQSIV